MDELRRQGSHLFAGRSRAVHGLNGRQEYHVEDHVCLVTLRGILHFVRKSKGFARERERKQLDWKTSIDSSDCSLNDQS
jgi:hypothetical protein